LSRDEIRGSALQRVRRGIRLHNCGRSLRTQLAAMSEIDHLALGAGDLSGTEGYFDATTARMLYASEFPIGPRGGAMIDFGRAIVLECLAPYTIEKTGRTIPFMPLPLNGRTVIHDIGRTNAAKDWNVDACLRGTCRCTDRPSGWRLTKPIIRAMLNCTDAFLHERGRQLPGLISTSWELAYHAPIFMTECYFNPSFLLPTRAASRAARARRTSRRSIGWRHHEGRRRR
jgi:hypothetical protein